MRKRDKDPKRIALRRLTDQKTIRSRMLIEGAAAALKKLETVGELDAVIELLTTEARQALTEAELAVDNYYSSFARRSRRRIHVAPRKKLVS